MNGIRWIVVGVLVFSMACGDDDDDATNGTVLVDSGTDLVNQCQAASDQQAAVATYDGKSSREVSEDCGRQGFATGQTGTTLEMSTASCIVTATDGAFSEGCATCFAKSVVCTATNCLEACDADPASETCLQCRCGANTANQNCVTDFETCAGIPSTDDCTSVN